jgi:isopropylmalate/homocitrate/citramalate synthase
LGYGCGKTIIKHKLKEMGISATDDQMREIAQKVKEEAYIRKSSIPDIQFEIIVKNVLSKKE